MKLVSVTAQPVKQDGRVNKCIHSFSVRKVYTCDLCTLLKEKSKSLSSVTKTVVLASVILMIIGNRY